MNNTAPFSQQMQEEFMELDEQGFSDGDILKALRVKYTRVPKRNTVRKWRVANRTANPLPAEAKAELFELMQNSLDIVGDHRLDLLDLMLPNLVERLENDEDKKMDLGRVLDNVRKLLSDIAQSAERVMMRKSLEESGITQHQQVLISIQNRANTREANNGSSDTIIDVAATGGAIQSE